MFVHEWFCVCSWFFVEDDSNDLLLHFCEWLKVCFSVVVAPPYHVEEFGRVS